MISREDRKPNRSEPSAPRKHAKEIFSSKKIAVLRLHLPDGTTLTNQLLEFDGNGKLSSYTSLTKEVAFCEWHRGDWHCEDL